MLGGSGLLFYNDPAPTEISTLSLHDALPIRRVSVGRSRALPVVSEGFPASVPARSEEHTSELQSRGQLVCPLLLEKKKKNVAFIYLTDPKKDSHPDSSFRVIPA